MIAAINNQQPPEPTAAAARLRDEINLMLRASDDSADFETADIVCKAALRAEKLLKEIERGFEQKQPAALAA
jgi:hypothetical protein